MPERRALFHIVSLFESVYSSAGIDELLLAGKERMALRADIDMEILLGGTGLEGRTASALNGSLLVLRMYAFLHDFHLFKT